MADVIPQPNVNPEAQPWARSITDRLIAVESQVNNLSQGSTNNIDALNSNMNILSQTLNTLKSQVNYVSGLQVASSSSTSTTVSITANSWSTATRPSITFTPQNGKALITISSNIASAVTGGGTVAATFSIPGYVDRNIQIGAFLGGASYNQNCLALSGGNGITLTGSFTQLVTGLPNTPITATFECYALTAAGYFQSPTITAQIIG
jgi:hypothetical protein